MESLKSNIPNKRKLCPQREAQLTGLAVVDSGLGFTSVAAGEYDYEGAMCPGGECPGPFVVSEPRASRLGQKLLGDKIIEVCPMQQIDTAQSE